MKYGVSGAAGAASITAADAGILKIDNPSSSTMGSGKIYEMRLGPAGASQDENYHVQLKRQSTAGTWGSVTPSDLGSKATASVTLGGADSSAAGTAGVVLGRWGFHFRTGMLFQALPGGEPALPFTFSHGLILEYVTYVQAASISAGHIWFDE